jgi:hypothetical protein
LYKRWQPLYDDIKAAVSDVEFIRGIPDDLDDDAFFDPKIDNLIVLDDLMAVANKDPRIADLFTEGSHHRNLSVMSLQQSVFPSGNKSCTMRRNCHYIVLFKNPADKRQIMTLAQHMYPNKASAFMDAYEKATRAPHGYLLVDLKQSTNEEDRLVTDIFNDESKKRDDSSPPSMDYYGGDGKLKPPPPPGIPDRDTVREGEDSDDRGGGEAPFWTSVINNGMWLMNDDVKKLPPDDWERVLFNFADHENIAHIKNPAALTHLAVLCSQDEPSPWTWECGGGCRGRVRAFYVSECPACKHVDLFAKNKGKTQMVRCRADDFIFKTGWDACRHIVELCDAGNHAFVSDHTKRKTKGAYPEVEVPLSFDVS